MKYCYICGCLKNVELYLFNVLENVEKVGKLFDHYSVIIAYDHSYDDTLGKLNFFKRRYEMNKIPFTILMCNNTFQERVENISSARNAILQHINKIESMSKEGDVEKFMIMLDMDDVCSSKIKPDVLEYYLNENMEWDLLSFNRDDYYDIWALSFYPFLWGCWNYDFEYEMCLNVMKHTRSKIIFFLNNLKKDELFKVYSAFNGFEIMRLKFVKDCTYNHKFSKQMFDIIDPRLLLHVNKYIKEDAIDCEHRHFHLEAFLKNRARVRVSPLKLFE